MKSTWLGGAYTAIPKHIAIVAAAAALAGCGPAGDDTGSMVAAHTDTPEPATDIGDSGETWALMQSHLHTTALHECDKDPYIQPSEGQCYSSEGVKYYLENALAYRDSELIGHGDTIQPKIDMIITDHNNIDAWFDDNFKPMASDDGEGYTTPLRGAEWSSKDGHMTVWLTRQSFESNAQALDEAFIIAQGSKWHPEMDDYQAAIDVVHELGGLVMINHPELLIHKYPHHSFGADGVEVGVKRKAVLQSTKKTRLWWHELLMDGDRLTGTAGADHHHVTPDGSDVMFTDEPIFGVAVNLMRIDPKLDDPTVAEALADPQLTIDKRSDVTADVIRRGHNMIIEDLDSPRVYLGADTDLDGRYHDARAGDCVRNEAVGSTINVRIRVTHANLDDSVGHYNVRVFNQNDGDAWFITELDPTDGFEQGKDYKVDPDEPFAIVLKVPVDKHAPGFIRVEIEDDVFGPINDTKTISNPIYYGDWGSECAGSHPIL